MRDGAPCDPPEEPNAFALHRGYCAARSGEWFDPTMGRGWIEGFMLWHQMKSPPHNSLKTH